MESSKVNELVRVNDSRSRFSIGRIKCVYLYQKACLVFGKTFRFGERTTKSKNEFVARAQGKKGRKYEKMKKKPTLLLFGKRMGFLLIFPASNFQYFIRLFARHLTAFLIAVVEFKFAGLESTFRCC